MMDWAYKRQQNIGPKHIGPTKKRQEVTRSVMKCQEASRAFFFVFFTVFIGLGAKSENLSSVAPPGKRNLVAIMAKTHVLGT